MIHDGFAYDVRGEGDWLLMINGIGAARDSWALQIDDLAARFRVITLDNRGVGDSLVAPGPYSTRQMAADAAALVKALGVERTHVMGVSMGGAIAQEFAINYPELVDRLAIVCSWAACDRYLERCFLILRHLAVSEGPKGRGWSAEMRRFLALIAYARDDFAHAYDLIVTGEKTAAEAVAAGREQSVEGFAAQADACLTHDTRGRLASIAAPTLVLAGTEDAFTPFPLSQALAAAIPEATLDTMPGCGHVMFYERPAAFNARLASFLADR